MLVNGQFVRTLTYVHTVMLAVVKPTASDVYIILCVSIHYLGLRCAIQYSDHKHNVPIPPVTSNYQRMLVKTLPFKEKKKTNPGPK